MSKTAEVAAAFTEMLKAGKHMEAAEKFNAKAIVSIEAMDGPMARVEGTKALKAKSDWWYANHTVHKIVTEGPFVNGDQFAVHFTMDVTSKDTGKRNKGSEIAIYTVKRGRIVEERFFYGM
jgi:predicted ester cyclase